MSYKNIYPWRKPEYDTSKFVTYELKLRNKLVAISVDDNKKILELRKDISDFEYISSTEKITCYSFVHDKEKECAVLNVNYKTDYEANLLIPAPKKINSLDEFISNIFGAIFDKENEEGQDTLPVVPSFSNTIFEFKEDVNFNLLSIPSGYSNFDDCIFRSKVNFSDVIFKEAASFKRAEFENDVLFNDAVFNFKAVFWGAKFFGNVSFENTNFKKLADFWSAHFKMKTDFFKTRFDETVVFSETSFNEDVLFSFANLGNMIFRQAEFEKGIDLSLVANPNGWSGNFFDIKHDFQNIDKSKIEYINQRETFRIIKDQLLKQNNNIEALPYRSLEMKAYNKELQEPENENKNKGKEQFLMGLNQSNEYGLDYVLPAGILMFSNLIFTKLLIIAQSQSICENKHYGRIYWQLLDPAIKPSELFDTGIDINGWTYFIFFISRLFLAYLIFQTISAFRKHSK